MPGSLRDLQGHLLLEGLVRLEPPPQGQVLSRQVHLDEVHRHGPAHQRRHRDGQRHAAGGARHAGPDLGEDAGAGDDGGLDLLELLRLPGISGEPLELGPRREQPGQGRLGRGGTEGAARPLELRDQAGGSRNARPVERHAVERGGLHGIAGDGTEELEQGAASAGGAEALAPVVAAAVGGELPVGEPEPRIVAPDVDAGEGGELGLGGAPARRLVPDDPPRLPRPEAPVLVVGHVGRVGRQREGVGREPRRGDVMAVGVLPLHGEPGDDHVGAEPADGEDDVGEHRVPAPDGERLLGALRVAEVARAREELLRAVLGAGREQLLGADEPEPGTEVRPDEVLAPVAPGDRQVSRAEQHPVGEVGEQPGVLVVGVGRDEEDVAHHEEPVELPLEPRRVGLGRAERGGGGGRGGEQEGCHGGVVHSGHLVGSTGERG